MEVSVSEGSLYRTRIHCYFLDQSRIVNPLATERNYHIFYQLLAGLSQEHRSQLGLENMTVGDLKYLNQGDTSIDYGQEEERFKDWTDNLAVLGIPFMDVVRVLVSILLLGNVSFEQGAEKELEVGGKKDLESVARLLGVTSTALFNGLAKRTCNVGGQVVRSYQEEVAVSSINLHGNYDDDN